MINYAMMRPLDVWYDMIDEKRIDQEIPTDQSRERFQRRLKEAREKSAPQHLVPKLAELHGAKTKIKDEPPLIFHPTEQEASGFKSGYSESIALYRASLPEHVRVLLGRFSLRDLAIKVVGVGSVGTKCGVALLTDADDAPIVLQIKEARRSVLEPYAAKSRHENQGERIVVGQHLMQSASDIFLGWMRERDGRDAYVRQLRDMKISAVTENWHVKDLRAYGRLCAAALAQAHARSGDAASIAGYMGSNSSFDDAVCEFAVDYADQNKRDYQAFMKEVGEGRIKIIEA
jgi:hypothetical protein